MYSFYGGANRHSHIRTNDEIVYIFMVSSLIGVLSPVSSHSVFLELAIGLFQFAKHQNSETTTLIKIYLRSVCSCPLAFQLASGKLYRLQPSHGGLFLLCESDGYGRHRHCAIDAYAILVSHALYELT